MKASGKRPASSAKQTQGRHHRYGTWLHSQYSHSFVGQDSQDACRACKRKSLIIKEAHNTHLLGKLNFDSWHQTVYFY